MPGIARNAVLTREEDAWRRIRINVGSNIRRHRRQIHLGPAISIVAPRKCRFVPQPEIQRKPPIQTIVVLDVNAGEFVAVGFEFSRALLERIAVARRAAVAHRASEKVLVGRQSGRLFQVGVLRAEIHDTRLVELVVQVHLAPLDKSPEVEVVLALFPAHIVGIGKIISREDAARVVTNVESILHADALNCVRRGLERQRDSKTRQIHGLR